jgi:hypothetical protein
LVVKAATILIIKTKSSYIVNSIYKWIADAVAHGQPIAAEPDEIDEFVPA